MTGRKLKAFVLLILTVVFSSAFAVNDSPQTFTLDGQLFKVGTTNPLLDSNAEIVIQILSKDATCVLYEEHQFVDTSASAGYFNIQVGSDTSSTKRTSNDKTHTMAQVFQNLSAITGNDAAGQTCASGSYQPLSGDARLFRLIVTPSATHIADTLTPDMTLDSVPNAIVAETVQGLDRSGILQVNNGGGVALTQPALEAMFTNPAYGNLQKIMAGNFMETSAGGAALPVFASNPGAPVAGDVWYDSVSNVMKYYDGTVVKIVSAQGTSVTGITAGLGLLGGTITSSGTIAVDVGTGANKIVQLTSVGKYPAVDGSLITNIPAITALTGDVTAAGPGSAAATIVNDAITSAKIASAGGGTSRILITDPTTGSSVGYASCVTAGEVLQWTPSGWACATVSSFLGTSGVTAGTYGNTTQVAQVTADSQGRVTALTNVNINFPVTSVNGKSGGAITLNGGDLGLGTASTQDYGTGANQLLPLNALAQIPAVDGSLVTNVNAVKLTGRTVSNTAPAGGQVLAWNSTTSVWEPGSVTNGTVTNVTAGSGLLGGTINNVGTLSVDTGTTANKIVQLDNNAKIPAVDGSQVTNINATRIGTRTIATSTPANGQVISWNNTTSVWEPTGLDAANIGTGTLPIARGGTGQTTQQTAMNALAGGVTSAQFLRGNGTNVVMAGISASDVPTLNQNTTGSAAKWTTARNLAGNSVDGSADVAFANKFIAQGTADAGLSAAQFLGSLGTGIVKNTTTTGVLSIAIAADFPTLNQNTTGTAANVTGTVAIGNGGTGQTSQQAAINALAGGVTSAQFLRGNGTNVVMAGISASDVPTLNQNTTGSAAKWTTARNLAGNSVDGSANVAFANKFIVQGTADAGLSAAQFMGALGTGIIKNTTTTGVFSVAIASDFPTLNQNTTGTAANVTGTVAIGNGGTGQTSQQAAINALAGGVTSAQFLRGNGTNVVMAGISATDVPTLNQNTTGSAAKWTTARNLAGNSVDGSANVAFANKFIVQGTADAGLSAAQFMGSLGTGIIKNTTTTGVFSVAIASDFPTLNQNTTGTAANVTGVVAIANGGTGSSTQNFVDLTNTQTITGSKTWSNSNYFLSNKGAGSYVSANNNYALMPYSTDGGAAGISFHRSGAYAVNFGLDPDNVMRIGGWSAAANRWQLDMSGNETIAGNMSLSSTVTFSAANPTLQSASSYITIPNGLYVSGGTPYFQTQIQARGGIHNDSAAYLQMDGGTSGMTYFPGTVGIGTSNPDGPFNNVQTSTATAGTIYSNHNYMTVTPSSASSANYYQNRSEIFTTGANGTSGLVYTNRNAHTHNGSGTVAYSIGTEGISNNNSNGTLSNQYGIIGNAHNISTGTVSFGYAGNFTTDNTSSGTYSNATGIQSNVTNSGGGSMPNATGIANYVTNSNGAMTSMIGYDATLSHNTTGTVSWVVPGRLRAYNNSSGTLSNVYNLELGLTNSGTISNWHGIHIPTITGTAPGSRYPIWVQDPGMNYFAGDMMVAGNSGWGSTAPTIALAIGDTDTGLDWVSDGIFELKSNGVAAATINGTYVGIGTANPAQKLEVNGTIRAGGLETTSDTSPANNNVNGIHIGSYISVQYSAGTPLQVGRSAAGAIMDVFQGGVNRGGISVSGATVTYTAFTGSHFAMIREPAVRGDLVELSGTQIFQDGDSDSEPIYDVQLTREANSSRILGSMLSLREPSKKESLENPYQIMAVGNGDVWVVDTGRDIEIGDYLISSAVPGHAEVDKGDYPVAHVFARAAQRVKWDEVEKKMINGRRHLKITITYEMFDRYHYEKTESRVQNLEAEVQGLKSENKELKAALCQLHPQLSLCTPH